MNLFLDDPKVNVEIVADFVSSGTHSTSKVLSKQVNLSPRLQQEEAAVEVALGREFDIFPKRPLQQRKTCKLEV